MMSKAQFYFIVAATSSSQTFAVARFHIFVGAYNREVSTSRNTRSPLNRFRAGEGSHVLQTYTDGTLPPSLNAANSRPWAIYDN